jgi:hypothetical protein
MGAPPRARRAAIKFCQLGASAKDVLDVEAKLGDAPTIACPSMCAVGAGKISETRMSRKRAGCCANGRVILPIGD